MGICWQRESTEILLRIWEESTLQDLMASQLVKFETFETFALGCGNLSFELLWLDINCWVMVLLELLLDIIVG